MSPCSSDKASTRWCRNRCGLLAKGVPSVGSQRLDWLALAYGLCIVNCKAAFEFAVLECLQ
eukprot:3457983-Prymnesium_polylepis.1